ncbi:hypothetical protein [uncultured Pseudokineococcus sp.]|uniref:hypothetical protein n=1 Tax=uncultured Pseudokineococcus sp. TaxID=1642928 RepID=UPI0026151E0E|nr:hypothetical protein [uncultured Pseudokineococcus sp.]
MDALERARRIRGEVRHPRDLRRLLTTGRWPRGEMALKAAVAALLAWQVALWLPFAPAEQYPYYAPLGAVVAAYPSVRSSTVESLYSVAAIIAGAALAVIIEALIPAQVLLVPAVVGVGIVVAGLPVFGSARSWVPIVALFTLVIGATEPLTYALAYTGLTLLGATLAVLLNLLLPTVPLAQSSWAIAQLATTLADQLDDLADGLESDDPPTSSQWRDRARSIDPVLQSVRASGLDVRRSLRANARARRERGVVDRQRSEALVLESVATRTADLTDLLIDVHAEGETGLDVEDEVREPTARALRAAAAAVRPLGEEPAPRAAEVGLLRQRVRELSEAVAEVEVPDRRAREATGAVVTALRRLLGGLASGLEDQAERDAEAQEAVTPTS